MLVLEPRDAWLKVTSDVGTGAKGCLVEGYKLCGFWSQGMLG
jgi:hypothetical protein